MAYKTINGIQIYYDVSGNDTGETILFLHGLGSSSKDWLYQLPAFEASYQTLVMDMRGHGQSDKPTVHSYKMTEFASDVIALLNQLAIDKVHVVGLSMGGMITFQLAVDYPERIQSMTIINSGPAVVVRSFKDRSTVWMRFLIVRLLGMKKMGETLAPRLFVDDEHEELRQMFIKNWAENDPKAYMAAMRAIVGWSVESQIDSISIPSLTLASDQDYTPISAKESYVAKMPNAQLKIIDNAHHAAPVERPEIVNAFITEFIKQHTMI
ncbi:MAG: alpha/beta hydrolase [Phototrophicaceae bacterium]